MKSKIGIQVKNPKEKCKDKNCPFHGTIKIHGRIFKGKIVSKDTHKTAVVKWPRLYFLRKYERFEKRQSKVKVHNPPCIDAKIGDKVKIVETRPLSKTKRFVIVENESTKS
jgi:small subunit ribosomal protein S17